MSEPQRGPFDPTEIIRILDQHDVRYVLVGGVAARLHGSPSLTEDIDLTPDRSTDNLRRLAAALDELGARLAVPDREQGLEVPLDENTFSSPVMKFTTRAGEIDIVLEPAGVGGFERLEPNAVEFEVFDIHIKVAALDDIITSKEAASRPKDLAQLEILRELRQQLDRRHDRGLGRDL